MSSAWSCVKRTFAQIAVPDQPPDDGDQLPSSSEAQRGLTPSRTQQSTSLLKKTIERPTAPGYYLDCSKGNTLLSAWERLCSEQSDTLRSNRVPLYASRALPDWKFVSRPDGKSCHLQVAVPNPKVFRVHEDGNTTDVQVHSEGLLKCDICTVKESGGWFQDNSWSGHIPLPTGLEVQSGQKAFSVPDPPTTTSEDASSKATLSSLVQFTPENIEKLEDPFPKLDSVHQSIFDPNPWGKGPVFAHRTSLGTIRGTVWFSQGDTRNVPPSSKPSSKWPVALSLMTVAYGMEEQ